MALTSLDKDNVNRLMEMLSITDLQQSKTDDIFKHNSTNYGKLSMIAMQIESLQKTAAQIAQNMLLNKKLHDANCNFVKVHGQVYHFYEQEEGLIYCSLIGPSEWSLYYKHFGTYLYDYDGEFKKV